MANRTVSVNLVASIGQYVSSMNKAAAATMQLGDSADKSAAKTKTGFDLAGKGALIMGGAIAGGMAMAISKSMEFEKSMSAVKAATGAAAGTLGELRDAAMKAGADTQYSATEAADAITEMSKAGVSAKDIMGGGLKGALSLAAAGQLEVADAAGIASVAMTQFNLSGEDLPHVADLLAAGAGKAMGSVDDLGQALNQAGLVASAAGLSIEETTGGLAAFAAAGLLGSDAGTSMKVMLQSLQAPSGKSAELMAELGLQMYDANGNMLGLSEMAGELQSKLSGLTEEQRNAALAQIFGSDAVRAANVLYKEGAAGIEQWIGKVNDQGYAAEQAAALTDNLAGDLERLGGSFDTLLITLGEGAQGPLRMLVQALGGVVDGVTWMIEAWDSVPGPVQAGIAALAAVHVLGGPVSTAVKSISVAIDVMTASFKNAGGPMSLMKSGAGGLLGVLGGPWGLAITGATVALTGLWSWLNNTGEATDEAKSATEGYAQALKQSSGALDENVRAAAAKAAEDSGLLSIADKAGIKLGSVTDAIMGQTGALKDVRQQLRDYITDNTLVMQTENGPQTHLTAEAEAAQKALAALDLLAKQGPETAASQDRVAEASGGAAVAQDDFAAATAKAEQAVDDAKQAVDAFKLALDILTGAHVSMIQVEGAMEAAIAEAEGALEDMTGSVLDASGALNLKSESGRGASDVLLEIRDSGNLYIAQLRQQGASEDEVREKDRQLRESFIRSAGQMGINRQAAEVLADQILGIPDRRHTVITSTANAARGEVSALQAQINGLTGKTVTVKVVTDRAALAVYAAQNGMRTVGGYAHGGYTGQGGKYEPAGIVHKGEYVLTKEQTSRLGIDQIEAFANRGYADGGIVVQTDSSDLRGGMQAVTQMMANSLTKVGTAGGGAVGGAWGSLWQLVKAAIPAARINSTFRAGDPGYHGRGKAIDFGFGGGPGGAGSAGLASINRLLHDRVGRNLAELIYDGIGDDRPDLKNGRPLTYNAGTRAAHKNHVHAAVYHNGTDYVPSTGFAYLEKGEAVIPAALNPRSREFSGGRGGAGGAQVVIHSPITFTGPVYGEDAMRQVAVSVVTQRDAALARNVRSSLG